MLSTLRRDRRTRRQSQFHLETLDERLVLSAAATGAVAETTADAAAVEHRQEVKAARHEALLARQDARHEAKLARIEARHEAKMAFISARSGTSAISTVAIPTASTAAMTSSTSTGVAASANPATTTTSTPSDTGLTPSNYVPNYTATTPTTGTGTGTDTGSTTNSGPNSSGPLPANVGAALQTLYQEYESAGGGSSFTPSSPSDNQLQISGTSVGVNLKVNSPSEFDAAMTASRPMVCRSRRPRRPTA